MRKVFNLILVTAFVVVFPIFIYLTYKVVEESRVVRGVTIRVLTSDKPSVPIPETIIRLESEDGSSAIQTMTDRKGEAFFKSITPGVYKIRATQIYCDNGKTEARAIIMKIQGSNVRIEYYPC